MSRNFYLCIYAHLTTSQALNENPFLEQYRAGWPIYALMSQFLLNYQDNQRRQMKIHGIDSGLGIDKGNSDSGDEADTESGSDQSAGEEEEASSDEEDLRAKKRKTKVR